MDNNHGSVKITFSGAVSGTTTPNSYGSFDFTTTNANQGWVYANATDQDNNSFGSATDISATPPSIFFNISYGSGGRWITISGWVMDIDQANRTVTFSGVASGSAVTDANGSFSLMTQATGLGSIQASVTDLWAMTGTAQGQVTSSAPTISFTATDMGGNVWSFEGHVQDQSPSGLEVILGGLPELQNATVTTDANGNFQVNIMLQPGERGTATAQAADWWGLNSNLAVDPVA
jgi:hypothetical protein